MQNSKIKFRNRDAEFENLRTVIMKVIVICYVTKHFGNWIYFRPQVRKETLCWIP
jgi:hypothetical protein